MSPVRVAIASAVPLAFSVAAITQADPDLWGHLRFGLDILDARELAAIDPYSFTQDRTWVNHEWLSELLMGVAWLAGGTAGLAMLKATLALSALLVVAWVNRGAHVGLQIAILGGAAVTAAQITHTLRPQLWSLVGIACLCAWLQGGDRPRLWRLLLLFCIWANAHGGWIVGLGIVVAWAVVESAVNRERAGRWGLVILASSIGSLLTPYGWRLWLFMLETVRLSRPMIEDWKPLWSIGPEKWLLWAAVAGWGIWLWPRLSRARLASAAVLIMLALASINVVRILPLFAIAVAVLLAPAAAIWKPRRPLTPLSAREESMVVGVLSVACLVGAVWIGSTSFRCIEVDDERMPDRAIAGVLAGAAPGRLVTWFNWGEYALWHVGPAIKVSMDGRRETVYSERRLAEHDAILFGRPEGFETLAEWQPEYVWLPRSSSATRDWLVGNGYRIDLESDESFVAVRSDLPKLIAVTPRESQTRCFPA